MTAPIDTDAEQRFYELAWPHMDAVLRTAVCLTRSAADAEDLAQETMLKAFQAIGTVRDGSKVKAWLLTILRRTRIDDARSTKALPGLGQLEIDPACDEAGDGISCGGVWDVPEQILNSFSDNEIIRALRELPKKIRWALLLVDVEGLDQKDAADVLLVPHGTIKSRLHRGRAMLRTTLVPSRAVRRETATAGTCFVELHATRRNSRP